MSSHMILKIAFAIPFVAAATALGWLCGWPVGYPGIYAALCGGGVGFLIGRDIWRERNSEF